MLTISFVVYAVNSALGWTGFALETMTVAETIPNVIIKIVNKLMIEKFMRNIVCELY